MVDGVDALTIEMVLDEEDATNVQLVDDEMVAVVVVV